MSRDSMATQGWVVTVWRHRYGSRLYGNTGQAQGPGPRPHWTSAWDHWAGGPSAWDGGTRAQRPGPRDRGPGPRDQGTGPGTNGLGSGPRTKGQGPGPRTKGPGPCRTRAQVWGPQPRAEDQGPRRALAPQSTGGPWPLRVPGPQSFFFRASQGALGPYLDPRWPSWAVLCPGPYSTYALFALMSCDVLL